MTIQCPECRTAFSDEGLGGRDLVHCPTCGRGISRAQHSDVGDAAVGPSRTAGLAILSLVCGIGALLAPLCICPFALLAPMMVAGGAPVTVAPTGVGGTVPGGGGTFTITMPDGTVQTFDAATGQPIVPPPPAVPPAPVPAPPPDDGSDAPIPPAGGEDGSGN